MKGVHRLSRWLGVTTLIFALAVVGYVSLPLPAEAATASGALDLITSPLPISLVAKPGTTVTTQLRIQNAGPNVEHMKVGLLKFGAYGDEGKPELLDFAPTDTYANWVTFSQPTFDAQPHVWDTITMTIKLPKTAAFGYYYAVTFSRAGTQRPTGNRTNVLSGATAVLVLLDADVPNAHREVDVADFVSAKGFYEYLPATFEIRLHNSGNVHLSPSGNIFISQGKNQQIGLLDVNKDLGFILPNSNRIFEATWNDGFPKYVQKTVNGKLQVDKRSDPVMRLDWNFNDINKIRFGRYTAHLLMVYDNGTRDIPIEAQVSFWVIPWRFILVVVVVVGLMLLGLWASLGGLRRRLRPAKKRRRG